MRAVKIVLFVLAFAALAALPALATDRDRTVELLESARATEGPDLLEVWLNDDRGTAGGEGRTSTPLESEVSYHFLSRRDGFLTALHVNSHGAVTVMYPGTEAVAVKAGERLDFPPTRIVLPLGNEDLYVFATASPLTLGDLGVDGKEFPLIERDEAPVVVTGILERVTAAQPFASTRVSSRVTGRVRTRGSSAAPVLADDIIQYFAGARTRGQKRANVDLFIHFESNSDKLTDKAIVQLDEVGKAFAHDRMREFVFIVGGHTDVRGAAEFNRDLSGRRARAVQRYLVEKHGITADRLTVKAFGETELLRSDSSEEAHSENRRVEFRWVNER